MKSGKDFDPTETREWIESLDDVIDDQELIEHLFFLMSWQNTSWIKELYLLTI